MGFFNEITSLFKEEELDRTFKIECFGSSAVVISGYKKVISLLETEVVLALANGKTIAVSGAKLFIKRFEESEIVVAGMIMNISLDQVRGGV